MRLNGLGSLAAVHHLNCGSISSPFLDAVTHVLLCEFEHGVVLVDVGLGSADIEHPIARIGVAGKLTFGAVDHTQLAISQLTSRGIATGDVAAIIATHLDFDHVGGVSDFPDIPVFVDERERSAAFARRSLKEHGRYRKPHLHDLEQVVEGVDTTETEPLPFGLGGVALDESETLWLLPLAGHTRGHCAVAVRTSGGWLVHAGDAFFSVGTLHPEQAVAPTHQRAETVERLLAIDKAAIGANHDALRTAAGCGAVVICSHDLTQFRQMSGE